MTKSDGFVTITFPNGAVYSVRQSHSGVILDAAGAPVDIELADQLLGFKAWKLAIAIPPCRSC
jgi:hypothetical protein